MDQPPWQNYTPPSTEAIYVYLRCISRESIICYHQSPRFRYILPQTDHRYPSLNSRPSWVPLAGNEDMQVCTDNLGGFWVSGRVSNPTGGSSSAPVSAESSRATVPAPQISQGGPPPASMTKLKDMVSIKMRAFRELDPDGDYLYTDLNGGLIACSDAYFKAHYDVSKKEVLQTRARMKALRSSIRLYCSWENDGKLQGSLVHGTDQTTSQFFFHLIRKAAKGKKLDTDWKRCPREDCSICSPQQKRST